MNIKITEFNGIPIAELIADNIVIKNTQDALDMMANSNYLGATGMIVHQKHLLPDFFDLKTGIAGEILQKFSTYNSRLAIIGDFDNTTSKSLRDFIYESNKIGRINFVSTLDDARAALSK